MENKKHGARTPVWFLVLCLLGGAVVFGVIVYGAHKVFNAPEYIQPQMKDGEDPLDALKRERD